jgi:hypothetical protein
MASKDKKKKKDGDPLKMYVGTMFLLVLVMAGLYFMIQKTRKEYEEANQRFQGLMRFEGNSRDTGATPSSVPDLAWEVESLAQTFREASGGAGLSNSIPRQMMATVATQSKLKQNYASGETTVKGGGGTYETVSQRFEYSSLSGGPPAIWQLLDLAWRIEARGRYRVSEIDWQVADKKDNPNEPFDLIKNPQIEVSLRVPTTQ